jgi:hypothetical protein
MHGNINFVWNKIKDKEKSHMFSINSFAFNGIFPSIDRKNRPKGLVVQIPPAALLYPCIQTILEGGGDVYRGGDLRRE